MHAAPLRVLGTAFALGSLAIGTCAAQTAPPAASTTALPAYTATTALPPTTSAAMPDDPTARRFADLDDNRDGTLTQDEYDNGADARFALLDTDRNNRVTTTELTAASPPQRDGMPSAADRIRTVDKNNDGELTDEEMRDGAEVAFRALDKNGNGQLDLPEMKSGAGVVWSTP